MKNHLIFPRKSLFTIHNKALITVITVIIYTFSKIHLEVDEFYKVFYSQACHDIYGKYYRFEIMEKVLKYYPLFPLFHKTIHVRKLLLSTAAIINTNFSHFFSLKF